MERKPYDFDPDKLAKGERKIYLISKTFHIDWSGWLERQFKKLFKKENGDDDLGKNEDCV